VSDDPIGFRAKDQNLYRYTINSPLTKIDPTGKIVPQVFAIANSQGMVIAGSVSTLVTAAQIVSYFALPNTNTQVPSGSGFREVSFSVATVGATLEDRYERLNGTGRFCPTSLFVGLTVTFYDADALFNDIAFHLIYTVTIDITKLGSRRVFQIAYGQRLHLTCRNTDTSTCVTVSAGGASAEVCDPWPWSTVDLYYEVSAGYYLKGAGEYDHSKPFTILNKENHFISYLQCI
jgi:hypothetical protein